VIPLYTTKIKEILFFRKFLFDFSLFGEKCKGASGAIGEFSTAKRKKKRRKNQGFPYNSQSFPQEV